MWGSQEKKLGQKVNVKYFRVDPYTLGNRIPRVFLNLSDLRVLGAIVKNLTLIFCPKFFLGVTIHVGESGKDFGAQSQ